MNNTINIPNYLTMTMNSRINIPIYLGKKEAISLYFQNFGRVKWKTPPPLMVKENEVEDIGEALGASEALAIEERSCDS